RPGRAPGRRAQHRSRRGAAPSLRVHDPGGRVRRPRAGARDEPGEAAPAARGCPRSGRGLVTGDYTFLVAVAAGLISFLSPCVLPLVPAYLGQLSAVAVASQRATGGALRPSRWTALRHSIAYVAGFGAVFTLLGVTATFAGGVLADYLPTLRIIGGVILVVMGLSLAGLLPIPIL